MSSIFRKTNKESMLKILRKEFLTKGILNKWQNMIKTINSLIYLNSETSNSWEN